MIRLTNGIRISLTSNCGFNLEDEAYLEAKKAGKASGRVKTGRSKCKRVSSDMDTPASKRSRPAKKDLNCIDLQIKDFNRSVLHLCETEAECPAEGGGQARFLSFVCCGPLLLTGDTNFDVEGDSDKPLPDPLRQTVELENAVLPEPDEVPPPSFWSHAAEAPLPDRTNPWNKTDPDEDSSTPQTSNCTKLLMDGMYNVVRPLPFATLRLF